MTEIRRRAQLGHTQRAIAEAFGIHQTTVSRLIGRRRGPNNIVGWPHSELRLSIEERIEICIGLERGDSLRAIARSIRRHPSTVSREVAANGGRRSYRPMHALRRSHALARRPKPTKLSQNALLRARVEADLCRRWSPEQIARRLKRDFGDDTAMKISHETIYKSLYVQGRGELRRELARCLRSGRARRVPQGRTKPPWRIPDMVMISERPAGVEDRAVPGHWEGDLLVGGANRSAVATLVERSTRYVMLIRLPAGRSAADVRDAMASMICTLPESLRRSITWDQGKEMTEHTRFTIETGVAVYFCDPHSPWQRGSNENTNGLLRQYFPKGTDLSVHDQAALDAVADELNGRPRKTLEWMTPAEKFAEFVATID